MSAPMTETEADTRRKFVVPNGTLFGDGIAARIKADLLESFDLHTIVRLPEGVFAPYTDIPANLIFFDTSGPTRSIRYAVRDLVFNIVFAWEGAVAIARDEDEGRVGSHRFLTCVPESGGPSVEFLLYYFLSREGLRRLGEASLGGAGRNRTLGLKKLAAITVPVPSPEKQRWFDRLQAKVRTLRKAHAETSGELDTLIPAMLHEVFGNERCIRAVPGSAGEVAERA